MTSRSENEPVFDIDFTALSRAVVGNASTIFIIAAVVGAITFAGLSTLTPRYASEARILIGGKGIEDPFRVARDAQNNRNLMSATISEEGVASQAQILKSQDLAIKVISALKLNQRAEFNPSIAEPSLFSRIVRYFKPAKPSSEEVITEKVLEAYSRSLEVVNPEKTRVLEVRFTSADPQLAAEIANHLSEFYLDWLSGQSISTNRSASNWLSSEIERLRVEVKHAERAVEDYKASRGFFVGGTQQTLLSSQELAELNSELAKAKALKSEAESRLQLVLANNAETSPDVVRSPLVQRLIEQRVRVERSVSANATLLRPAHPVMQKLNADLLSLKKQIQSEISNLADSLQKEVRVATLREEAVSSRLNELKSSVARSSDDSVELRGLEREAKSKRETLEFYLAKYIDASARQDRMAAPPEAEIFSRARPSITVVSPKKRLTSILAAIAALILGFGWVVTRQLLLSHTENPAEGVEHQHRTRLIALPERVSVTPRMNKSPILNRAVPATDYRSLRAVTNHLIAKASAQNTGYLTFASGQVPPKMGVAIVRRLAQSLSSAGKLTLLVDLSSQIYGANKANFHQRPYGFWDATQQTISIEGATRYCAQGSFHIMSPGRARPIVGEVTPHRINALVNLLAQTYDHIIVFENETELLKARSCVLRSRYTIMNMLHESQHTDARHFKNISMQPQNGNLDIICYTLNAEDEVPVLKQKSAISQSPKFTDLTNQRVRA